MKFGTGIRRALFAGCAAVLVAGAVSGSASAASVTGVPAKIAPLTNESTVKGPPPRVGANAGKAPSLITTPADGIFQYAQASQYVSADGARGYYTIAKPSVAPGNHSLAELTVESGDGNQVIEVGWTVDPGLNGDDDPHLFVYHWIEGVRTCYNGCGFVPFNEPGYAAGMKLPVTSTPVQFNILHHGTEWRVGYNGHWVGAFPDSEWTDRFKVTGLVQWFGEVNAPTAASCTEMGNGQPANSPTSARIERMGFAPAQVTVFIRAAATSPDAYSVLPTGPDSMRFGGAGSCRTVPNIVGTPKTLAAGAIANAGLTAGRATPITDPSCNNVNLVVTQTPTAGSRIPSGSRVNYQFGAPPQAGCP